MQVLQVLLGDCVGLFVPFEVLLTDGAGAFILLSVEDAPLVSSKFHTKP